MIWDWSPPLHVQLMSHPLKEGDCILLLCGVFHSEMSFWYLVQWLWVSCRADLKDCEDKLTMGQAQICTRSWSKGLPVTTVSSVPAGA